MKIVGVISDTHGLLRPEALEALAGVDLIIHAGDIGGPDIIDPLRRIAPVHAVRGNVDRGFWANEFSPTEIVEVEGQSLYTLHDLNELDLDPAAAGFRVVISGHTHDPLVKEERGVVYLNPGSAGPRRFKLPISLARISIGEYDSKSGSTPARKSNRTFTFGAGPQRIAVALVSLQ
jgi:putative phosphoesterase